MIKLIVVFLLRHRLIIAIVLESPPWRFEQSISSLEQKSELESFSEREIMKEGHSCVYMILLNNMQVSQQIFIHHKHN